MHRPADSGRDPAEAKPNRVVVDEIAVKISAELSSIYSTIKNETKFILDIALFGQYGSDPAAAFLHGLREKRNLSNAESLVDQFGCRTTFSRLRLNGQVNYTDRKLIGNCLVSSI